jgi:competence protein ComEC
LPARLWVTLAGFAAGIACGYAGLDVEPALALLVSGLATSRVRRRPATAMVGLAACAIALGVLAAAAARTESVLERMAARFPRCNLHGEVMEHAGGLGTLLRARALCVGHAESRGIVVVDGDWGPPGSGFSAVGRLTPLSDEGFDAARRRLGAHAAFEGERVGSSPPRSPLKALAARLRDGLGRSSAPLDADSGALLRGLTVGDTRDLDAVTVESLRRSGLSHLVAVSGSNVAIVLAAAAAAGAKLGRRLRLAASLAALVVFVVVVGPEPSVLRAAVMGALGLFALLHGRRAEPLHALPLALILVLALRPAMLFSVGLHLSAAATAGIVLWARPIADRMHGLWRPVATIAAATLAAQAGVAPILAAVFGEFSVVAPIANVLAVPVVPPATILGLSAAALGAIDPALGAIPARLAEPLAGWILTVGDNLGSLSWASVTVPRVVGVLLGVPVGAAALLASGRRSAPRK